MDIDSTYIKIENLELAKKFLTTCTYYDGNKISESVPIVELTKEYFVVEENGERIQKQWGEFLESPRLTLEEMQNGTIVSYCILTPGIYNPTFEGWKVKGLMERDVVSKTTKRRDEIFKIARLFGYVDVAQRDETTETVYDPETFSLKFIKVEKLDKIILTNREEYLNETK